MRFNVNINRAIDFLSLSLSITVPDLRPSLPFRFLPLASLVARGRVELSRILALVKLNLPAGKDKKWRAKRREGKKG